MGGGMAGGYNSGNEGGSSIGGIEIDPLTQIPYYDPTKGQSKSAKSL